MPQSVHGGSTFLQCLSAQITMTRESEMSAKYCGFICITGYELLLRELFYQPMLVNTERESK
jgi:hypothetical protein